MQFLALGAEGYNSGTADVQQKFNLSIHYESTK